MTSGRLCGEILLATIALITTSAWPGSLRATNLGALPLGSVIQIMGTDTGMCDDVKCTTATSPVLPYRFVKMQARRITTAGADSLVGSQGNCNSGSCNGYSYWMLMDNYCWWGSADCRVGYNYTSVEATWTAGDKGVYQAFNGNCVNWNGTTCLTDTTALNYSNNISDTKPNNILSKMANFYVSLPDNIGGKLKDNAVANYNWDMIGVTAVTTGNAAAGWNTSTGTNTRTWPATPSYTFSGAIYTFTGSNTIANPPVMTSKIGLLSFTEWQGGLVPYGSYPVIPGGNASFNPPTVNMTQPGTGSTFCKTRFNSFNCNLNNNGVNGFPGSFAANNSFTYVDDSGNSVFIVPHSAANPRIRYMWFRTPRVEYATNVYRVLSGSVTHSLSATDVFLEIGLSPTLWLASDIQVVGGAGTYDQPFCLAGGYCPASLSVTSTSGSASGGVVLSGMVNGSTINQDVILTAAVCNTDGECVTKSTTINTGNTNVLQGWGLNWLATELPSGTYNGTVWVNALANGSWLAAAQSDPINFTIAPRQYNLTVMGGQPFNLTLGNAAGQVLTAGSAGGVTVTVDSSSHIATASGTLSTNATLTFGNADLNFQVLSFPANQVKNLQFN